MSKSAAARRRETRERKALERAEPEEQSPEALLAARINNVFWACRAQARTDWPLLPGEVTGAMLADGGFRLAQQRALEAFQEHRRLADEVRPGDIRLASPVAAPPAR